MSYAKVSKGVIERYPYTFVHLQRDNPDVSYPRDPDDAWLAREGIMKVAQAARPAPSSLAVNIVEGTPALIGGVWTQMWAEVPAESDEVAARQMRATDEAARTSIKADSFVSNFIAMKPEQVSAYINANVTSLATAKPVIEKLALMVLLLARREFRD